ncbi:MAG: hypothetical protein HOY71_12745 [Nonomuraea sp.]|nr:hypothetical protein [Nonomuraea sp.]
MADQANGDDLVWPPNRYEVRWELPGDGVQSEAYSYPTWAREAARKLNEGGWAEGVHVVRLRDGHLLFDPGHGVELPIEEW